MAAVLLATSCSKDDETNAIDPAKTQNIASKQIPFSIKVSTEKSLKKIGCSEDNEVPGQYKLSFEEDDAGKLTLKIKEGTKSLGFLTLQKDLETFSGEIDQPSSPNAGLTAEITVGGNYMYSASSLDDLIKKCAHTFKSNATFTINATAPITLTDQNAYIAISMSPLQHILDVKSGNTTTKCILSKQGKVWVAVSPDANVSVGSFISKTANEVDAGEIYTISRPHCVDLGIPGILWTDHNIGGTNPEDWGDYFAWGETQPYYASGHAYDETCTNWRTIEGRTITGYNWATYSFFDGDETGQNFTKYNAVSHCNLSNDDDVAYKTDNYWSMPTPSEFEALKNNCYWVWTAKYNDKTFNNQDAAGWIVYKPKKSTDAGSCFTVNNSGSPSTDYSVANDPHIFLPAAGSWSSNGFKLTDTKGGREGSYWTLQSIDDQEWVDAGYGFDLANRCWLNGANRDPYNFEDVYRYYGYSVRAVRHTN